MEEFTEELNDHPEVTDQFTFVGTRMFEDLIKSALASPGFNRPGQVKVRRFNLRMDLKFILQTMNRPVVVRDVFFQTLVVGTQPWRMISFPGFKN